MRFWCWVFQHCVAYDREAGEIVCVRCKAVMHW